MFCSFKRNNYFCELEIRIIKMYSSQKSNSDLILTLLNDERSVYRLNDVAMLTGDTNFASINKRLNYFVRNNKINSPRRGIYTKANYQKEEMACRIFIPSYISLDYVLQKAGVIFQYSAQITSVSYLSRTIEVDQTEYSFRKIKNEIIVDTTGILRLSNGVNIATPERALTDTLYLNSDYYFDNLNSLNKELIEKLLPIYNSKRLTIQIQQLLFK